MQILDECTLVRIASVDSHLSGGVIDAGTIRISHDPSEGSIWDVFIAKPPPVGVPTQHRVLNFLSDVANLFCGGCEIKEKNCINDRNYSSNLREKNVKSKQIGL